jgi:hypothetical protein
VRCASELRRLCTFASSFLDSGGLNPRAVSTRARLSGYKISRARRAWDPFSMVFFFFWNPSKTESPTPSGREKNPPNYHIDPHGFLAPTPLPPP